MELLTAIKNYQPFNEQEALDKELILQQLTSNDQVFLRQSKLAHITVSAWIISPDYQKVLMAYHNIYQSWAWLGGHADGETNLKHVILKEIAEESGLTAVEFVTPSLFSLEVLTVDGHQKHGHYVSSHLHLNVTYLLQASDDLPLRIKADENSQVAWLKLSELKQKVSEPWFYDHIYSKLMAKIKTLCWWLGKCL